MDGSDAEYAQLTDELIEAGTLVRLNDEKKPNSFWARTDPSDVARVEQRTFICSVDEADAGPTNNWMDPAEMKALMTELYRGSHARPDDVRRPVLHGPADAEKPMFGVEITDSAYVVASMRIMARMGADVLDQMGTDAKFVPCLHSVGAPLEPGRAGRRRGRATTRSTSSSSPRSGRSGRTARATAATRCSARSATRCGSPR